MISGLREYRLLHMRGVMTGGPGQNSLLLPERLTLGESSPLSGTCHPWLQVAKRLEVVNACVVSRSVQNDARHAIPVHDYCDLLCGPGSSCGVVSCFQFKEEFCFHLRTPGVTKAAALRGTRQDVTTDERAAVASQIMTASVNEIMRLVYPAMYPVHDPAGGLLSISGGGVYPSPVQASTCSALQADLSLRSDRSRIRVTRLTCAIIF